MPRTRQIHPLGAEGGVAAAAEVEDFSEGRGVAPVLFQKLGQGDDIGQAIAEERAVVGDAGLVGAQAGEERAAAGIAHRVLHVGAIKADGAGGESVDVRRLDGGVAVATEGVAQIIDGDEQDVEFFRSSRGGGMGAADENAEGNAEQSADEERSGTFHGVVAVGTGKGSSWVAGCSPRMTFPARPVRRR